MVGNSIGSESLTGDAVEDILFRSKLAEKIAVDLLSKDADDRISMLAIHGSWGSGKTHFLKHLGREIVHDGNLVCGISAWLHEPEGELLASLLSELLEIENYPWRHQDASLLLRMRAYRGSREYLMALSDIFLAAGQVWGPAKAMSNIFMSFFQLFQFFRPERNWPSVKRIRHSFKHMIDKLLFNRYKHFYIIVDDLDRCSPPAMIRFVESIKNLLAIEKCTFIVAFDYEPTADAIGGHYSDYVESGKERDFGMRFLGKIFEQSYALPLPTGLDWLFTMQIDPNYKDIFDCLQSAYELELESSEKEQVRNSFREAWFCNPRAAVRAGRIFQECLGEIISEGDAVGRRKYFKGNIIALLLRETLMIESGQKSDIGKVNQKLREDKGFSSVAPNIKIPSGGGLISNKEYGSSIMQPIEQDDLDFIMALVQEKKFVAMGKIDVSIEPIDPSTGQDKK